MDEVGDVAETVVCEELCEFAVDAGVFDTGFDVLHVFVAEDLPDVLALDSFRIDPREICVGEVVVLVPDAVVVDASEIVDFLVGQDVLVVPEFVSILVSYGECDVNIIFEQCFGAFE